MIEASLDGGANWCDLGDPYCLQGYLPGPVWWENDSSLASHHIYDHPAKFSGKSDGWIFSRIHFDYAVGKSIENGWLVDNIIIGACDVYMGTPPAKEIKNKAEVVPNPLLDCSRVQLNGMLPGINEILIFNHAGETIMRKPVKPDETPLLFRKDFSQGIYLIQAITTDGRSCSVKFTVK